jgi:hypothetical protein
MMEKPLELDSKLRELDQMIQLNMISPLFGLGVFEGFSIFLLLFF